MPVTLEHGLFTHFTSAENWDVIAKKKESSEEFIHARQLVPPGEEYLFLLPKTLCIAGGGRHLTVQTTTTEAPIHFFKVCTVDSSLLFHFLSGGVVVFFAYCLDVPCSGAHQYPHTVN